VTGIVSASGLSARSSGTRFDFILCVRREGTARGLGDYWIGIATRHDEHARQTIVAMEAGKDVFVEKPLALTRDELLSVVQTQRRTGRRLMVGFNRRFAPMVEQMRSFLASSGGRLSRSTGSMRVSCPRPTGPRTLPHPVAGSSAKRVTS